MAGHPGLTEFPRSRTPDLMASNAVTRRLEGLNGDTAPQEPRGPHPARTPSRRQDNRAMVSGSDAVVDGLRVGRTSVGDIRA